MIIFRDLKFWVSRTPSKSVVAVLLNPCFHILALYRVAHFFYLYNIPFISKVLWFFARVVFAADIDWRAKIGERFFLVHGIGTTIGRNVILGNDVTVYQGVTLGGSGKARVSQGELLEQPILGDGVKVFAQAMVLGGVRIGDRAVVSAATVISSDVPANTTVKNRRATELISKA